MIIDLGDVDLHVAMRVKGLRHYALVWRIGVPVDTTPADRVVQPGSHPSTGRIDAAMDLQADKQVALSVQFTDEIGNPVEAPEGAATTYTVDDPTVINLTDNGDGTAVAAATGTLGVANVHVEAAFDGATVSGDLQIVVVAGLAERLAVVAGEPEEVTPDA